MHAGRYSPNYRLLQAGAQSGGRGAHRGAVHRQHLLEVVHEDLRLQRGAHHHQPGSGGAPQQRLLHQQEDEVDVQRPLVHFGGRPPLDLNQWGQLTLRHVQTVAWLGCQPPTRGSNEALLNGLMNAGGGGQLED